jgi:hypothetical protein
MFHSESSRAGESVGQGEKAIFNRTIRLEEIVPVYFEARQACDCEAINVIE